MKIYHICSYCDTVFAVYEAEGGEGTAELKGVCEDCSEQMVFYDNTPITQQNWYN